MKDLLISKYYTEEIVKRITFQLSITSKVHPSNLYKLELGKISGDTLLYESITVMRHRVYFSIINNKAVSSVGCQGNIDSDAVHRAIEELEGREMKLTKKCIFSKLAAPTATSRVVFLEESGTYLISGSLKAFSKKEFEVRETEVSLSIFRSVSNNTVNYKGNSINIVGNNKNLFLEKLYFMRAVMTYINNYLIVE